MKSFMLALVTALTFLSTPAVSGNLTLNIDGCSQLVSQNPLGYTGWDFTWTCVPDTPNFITQVACGVWPIENLGELKLGGAVTTRVLKRGPAVAFIRIPNPPPSKTTIFIHEVNGSPIIGRKAWLTRILCNAPASSNMWSQLSVAVQPTLALSGTPTPGYMTVTAGEIWFVMVTNLAPSGSPDCPGPASSYCNVTISTSYSIQKPASVKKTAKTPVTKTPTTTTTKKVVTVPKQAKTSNIK